MCMFTCIYVRVSCAFITTSTGRFRHISPVITCFFRRECYFSIPLFFDFMRISLKIGIYLEPVVVKMESRLMACKILNCLLWGHPAIERKR